MAFYENNLWKIVDLAECQIASKETIDLNPLINII